MRVGIFGRGRLATAVAAALERETGFELAWMSGSGEGPGEGAEVVLDASVADAVGPHLAWALDTRTDLVIGATGWEEGILAPLRAKGRGEKSGIGVMVAPNFSLGVAFLRRIALALGGLAASDQNADLGIIERHHRGKADSPSGTAKLLAAALAAGSGRHGGWCQGRAEAGKINIASLRSGTEFGYHEMRFEAMNETIVVSHEIGSRAVFAEGALKALRWIHGRRGLFNFDDMAKEFMDRLFLPDAGRERESTR